MGEKHGHGTYEYSDGSKKKCEFIDGQFISQDIL
jgi:hypothetical protein